MALLPVHHHQPKEALQSDNKDDACNGRPGFRCALYPDIKHLSENQDETTAAVRDQAVAQHELKESVNSLNNTIQALGDSLDKGFDVFKMGASLFKVTIAAFVVVIFFLGAVIVYITNVDINITKGSLTNYHESSSPETTTVPKQVENRN